MKHFGELIKDLEIVKAFYGSQVIENLNAYKFLKINGISENSKSVRDRYIFIARKGTTYNGEDFIEEAIENGAIIIIRESEIIPSQTYPGVIQIQVKNIKKAQASLISNFYNNPQHRLTLIGVTGTNGKTSVCYFVKTLLDYFGQKCGYIGTLFYEIDKKIPAYETTPSILNIAPLLKEMVDKNFKACAMEVSSHALSQDRIYGLLFDVAGFTNLSRDHLDYHKNMEDYYQAKKKLFTRYLKREAKSIISLETKYGKKLAQELSYLSPILVNNKDWQAKIIERKNGLILKMKIKNKEFKVETRLFGDYQAKNIVTVWGILSSLGYKDEDIAEAMKILKNPVGRLELVADFRGAKIFVDYAHTPLALKEALQSLVPLKEKRLIVIFGCGGNRDKGKRPIMGKIANLLADEIILTSDNPRFEDPLKIIEDIKKGINGVKPFRVIPDRREALREAIKNVEKGDIVLVAGKGHEAYQEIGGKRYPFSDQQEILQAIKEYECKN